MILTTFSVVHTEKKGVFVPKKVSSQDRVIRFSIGLPQYVLDALDEVVDEYNAMAEKAGDPVVSRSQFIGKSLVEAYGDPSIVEYMKAQLGVLQIKLDLDGKGKKGKK